ncbi:protein ASH-2, isoform c [Edwardsiella piscicida]|nr:protein ASH-2, isoform c [Edwardsiella piscicida]
MPPLRAPQTRASPRRSANRTATGGMTLAAYSDSTTAQPYGYGDDTPVAAGHRARQQEPLRTSLD